MKFKKSALVDSVGLILRNESSKKIWTSVVFGILSQSLYAQTAVESAPHIPLDPTIDMVDLPAFIAPSIDPALTSKDIAELKKIVQDDQFSERFEVRPIERHVAARAMIESPEPKQEQEDDSESAESNETERENEADTEEEKKQGLMKRFLNVFSRSKSILKLDSIRISVSIKNVDTADAIAKTEQKQTADQTFKLSDEQYIAAKQLLKKNIENQLSTVKQESFSSAAAALAQIRTQVNQAAEAVGFYETGIELIPNIESGSLHVEITPNYLAYFSNANYLKIVQTADELKAGQGSTDDISSFGVNPSFQRIIEIFPDFRKGDVLNQGLYEKTKKSVEQVAEDEGFFEGYWLAHSIADVGGDQQNQNDDLNPHGVNWAEFDKIIAVVDEDDQDQEAAQGQQPWRARNLSEQTGEVKDLELYPVKVDMAYITGPRYRLGSVVFCTAGDAGTDYNQDRTQLEQEEFALNSLQENEASEEDIARQRLLVTQLQEKIANVPRSCPENASEDHLPVDVSVLNNMVPWLLPGENSEDLPREVTWKRGHDYAAWRINNLTNSLAASRYFDRVEIIRKPDIYNLMSDVQTLHTAEKNLTKELASEKADETALLTNTDTTDRQDLVSAVDQQRIEIQETEKTIEDIHLPKEKVVNVDVIVSADKRNATDLGLGYGTDTGARLRGQYRRSIVNDRGHSFESNMELAQTRQSLDVRYLIPHYHAVYDYYSLVGGYEREERSGVVDHHGLLIESGVAGVDHIYTNPTGDWQYTIGLRYRLDRLKNDGIEDIGEKLDAFLKGGPEQQSLLFNVEATHATSDDPLKPTTGFKQTYKVELGAKGLLTDTSIAKLNARWLYLQSLDRLAKHQIITEVELGHIFTDDFAKVPYNLRYFAGGDQSLRGFDYKSLSPIEGGVKLGGQNLARGSLEYNYEFKPNWRAAIFTDVGNAYDYSFSNDTAYGSGVGIRWASPVGPMRIDVASGLSDENRPIRIHFFIGSQF